MVLTPDLEETLAAIRHLKTMFGYPPTYRDLGMELGIAHSAAYYRVQRLVQAGMVKDPPGIARGMQITDQGYTHLAGNVARNSTDS